MFVYIHSSHERTTIPLDLGVGCTASAASAATARREQHCTGIALQLLQGWTESQNTENSDDVLLFCHFCVEEAEFSTDILRYAEATGPLKSRTNFTFLLFSTLCTLFEMEKCNDNKSATFLEIKSRIIVDSTSLIHSTRVDRIGIWLRALREL
jgi:hypothetical protein